MVVDRRYRLMYLLKACYLQQGSLAAEENELINVAVGSGTEAHAISKPSHVSNSCPSLRMTSGAGGFA